MVAIRSALQTFGHGRLLAYHIPTIILLWVCLPDTDLNKEINIIIETLIVCCTSVSMASFVCCTSVSMASFVCCTSVSLAPFVCYTSVSMAPFVCCTSVSMAPFVCCTRMSMAPPVCYTSVSIAPFVWYTNTNCAAWILQYRFLRTNAQYNNYLALTRSTNCRIIITLEQPSPSPMWPTAKIQIFWLEYERPNIGQIFICAILLHTMLFVRECDINNTIFEALIFVLWAFFRPGLLCAAKQRRS